MIKQFLIFIAFLFLIGCDVSITGMTIAENTNEANDQAAVQEETETNTSEGTTNTEEETVTNNAEGTNTSGKNSNETTPTEGEATKEGIVTEEETKPDVGQNQTNTSNDNESKTINDTKINNQTKINQTSSNTTQTNTTTVVNQTNKTVTKKTETQSTTKDDCLDSRGCYLLEERCQLKIDICYDDPMPETEMCLKYLPHNPEEMPSCYEGIAPECIDENNNIKETTECIGESNECIGDDCGNENNGCQDGNCGNIAQNTEPIQQSPEEEIYDKFGIPMECMNVVGKVKNSPECQQYKDSQGVVSSSEVIESNEPIENEIPFECLNFLGQVKDDEQCLQYKDCTDCNKEPVIEKAIEFLEPQEKEEEISVITKDGKIILEIFGLLLENADIEIDQEDTSKVLVKNLDLPRTITKTIFLEKLHTDSDTICIKDRPISDLNDMSKNCNNEDEVLLVCDGIDRNGYMCIDEDKQFRVMGLKHSLVAEYQEPSNSLLYAGIVFVLIFIIVGIILFFRAKKIHKIRNLKEHELEEHALTELFNNINQQQIKMDLQMTEHDSSLIDDAISDAQMKYFLISSRYHNIPDEQTKSSLINQGWSADKIDEIIKDTPLSQSLKNTPNSLST
tara:strand:- start:699 stop:2561 length:1863 start_codon:yes stop_codon:yes gene_type:complete